MMKILAFLLFCGLALAVDPTIVPLSDYVDQGAVCLDGSTPAYYYRPGVGSGSDNWIIHIEGGGWCFSAEECYNRSLTTLGSSSQWPSTLSASSQLCCSIGGFLSDNSSTNPYFYDWNLAFVGYCDGSSFSGNVQEPLVYNETNLYLRGSRILESVITDLLTTRNLSQASNIIVTGCSAGGLSVYLHLDKFRNRIPSHIPVHGLSDGGFFLDYHPHASEPTNIPYKEAFELWNSTGEVNQNCINAYPTDQQWRCIMAPYTYPHIETPIFVLNSKYDSWQLPNVSHVYCTPPANCSAADEQAFLKFGATLQNTLLSMFKPYKDGMWVDECIQHCQSIYAPSVWTEVTIDGHTPEEAFYQWLTTGAAMYIDSLPYGNNPTCPLTVYHNFLPFRTMNE